MPHLNFQHLEYFWTVAREGSINGASEVLFVTPSTISVQLRKLEEQFEQKLFDRVGRGLVLTEVGRVAFRYADSIFSTGKELQSFLEGRREGGPQRVDVGVAHVLPKLVTWHLLEPATRLADSFHIVCREASSEQLVAELLLHQLDVILSDTPLRSGGSVRLFNHLLGESAVSFFAVAALAEQLSGGFPGSLDGAAVILPSTGTEMRRSLDAWFTRQKVRPEVVAEFDDLALLKVAGEHGLGVFPVPEVVSEDAAKRHGVRLVGQADGVVERFYAVSAERQIEHPAVVAIVSRARELLA